MWVRGSGILNKVSVLGKRKGEAGGVGVGKELGCQGKRRWVE